MGAIEKLSIAVPIDLADSIRLHVTSGEYDSADDIIVEALRLWTADEAASGNDPEVDAWLRATVVPTVEANRRDPSRLLTAEQVRANLGIESGSAGPPR